jgi:hypothetical protein
VHEAEDWGTGSKKPGMCSVYKLILGIPENTKDINIPEKGTLRTQIMCIWSNRKSGLVY